MIYDFDGARYEVAAAHQQEWGLRLIEELHLRGDERVLDLGCGDGTVTLALATALGGGMVTGIDASPGMIETASKKKRTNLRFALLDIYEMVFVEEFDLVISNAALHWLTDHHRLLHVVRRSLRDGGVVRFSFAGEGNCAAFIDVVREAMTEPRFAPCFTDFPWPWFMPPAAVYADLVREIGLRDSRVWLENADRFFADEQAMVRWIEQPSLVPFVGRVPVGLRAAFRDFVVERMIARTRQPDGRCFETFRRLNVAARR